MAKVKNKKQVSAEKVNNKKSKPPSKKTFNPFEVHINREKVKVLGRQTKYNKGFPGIARAKALTKRKRTLLPEYATLNKSNKFLDRRIGEKNFQLSEEDRTMARFTAERIKVHKKTSIFNLADDEILTHRGQTLSEIEKFDDPRSEDEESLEGDSGKLQSGFVEEAHFGGGVLKNTGREGARTHKELIDELIAESKKRKAEQQKIKESTLELTQKLDSEWKDLLPLVSKSRKEDEVVQPKVDDYDKVMRELRFEARGTPSDRLKTEDEIAKAEKERLEKLEAERLDRMKGNIEVNKSGAQQHRSADDLDDDVVYNSDPEYMLSYNEKGQSNVVVSAQIDGKDVTDDHSEDESETEDESEDNLSDLKDENVSESETEDQESESDEPEPTEDVETTSRMEEARNELPYTFSLPESYEDLQKTLANHSVCHQSVIIERMIKCNHPSLREKNKDDLGTLFVYLLQFLSDVALDVKDERSVKLCFETAHSFFPKLFELAQLNDGNAHNSVLEVIKEKQNDLRKRPNKYPDLSVLIYLKLVGCLFSTSDYRHQIVTPCFIFMEQMFWKCRVRTKRDLVYGLFVTTLVLEYTSLSHRYLPAAINYLTGVLHLALPKINSPNCKLTPPFTQKSPSLTLQSAYKTNVTHKLNAVDLIGTEIDDEFRVRCVCVATKLIGGFYENLQHLACNVEIFEGAFKCLKLLPKNVYPESFTKLRDDLVDEFDKKLLERNLDFIVLAQKRPKALRLYEPKIEVVYDHKRHKVQSKTKAERDKLMYKLKKERKGAMREIRRDKAFIGRVKLNEKIKSDAERKEKVKRIFSEAAFQQSELNSLDRKKKRKK